MNTKLISKLNDIASLDGVCTILLCAPSVVISILEFRFIFNLVDVRKIQTSLEDYACLTSEAKIFLGWLITHKEIANSYSLILRSENPIETPEEVWRRHFSTPNSSTKRWLYRI